MDGLLKSLPWDVKATINKVKNVVMNYTELESKVIDATNNDPWGASSTLMQDIARATEAYQGFNEIMPTIYKRLVEVEKNWRQTLQLIEYLIKNGSEKVAGNVQDHINEIRSLTNFQFVDEKGKDQGINVRHRAKEIIELVNDDTRLKDERQKALVNRNKYTGVSSQESRYGGFGSDSANKYSGFGSDSVSRQPASGGMSSSVPATSASATSQRPSSRKGSETDLSRGMPTVKLASETATATKPGASATTATATAPKAPAVNLLDLDFGAPAPAASNHWGSFAPAAAAKDEFSEFQSIPVVQPASASSGFGAFATPAAGFAAGFPSPQATNQPPATNANAATAAWSNFEAFPSPGFSNSQQQRQQPSAGAAKSDFTVPASKADIWQSNLVSLDSLGKFPARTNNTGPALNQLGASGPIAVGTNNYSASPVSFGGFAPPLVAQPPAQQQQQQQWGQFSAAPISSSASANNWGTFSKPAAPGGNQAAPVNTNDLLL